jgi:hypothetical protein
MLSFLFIKVWLFVLSL